MANPKMSPASVRQMVESTKKDPAQKSKVIGEISSLGFREFIKKYFELDARQIRELDTMNDRDAEHLVGQAVIGALRRDGPVEVIHEGHEKPNLRMEIGLGGKDGWGVKVYC